MYQGAPNPIQVQFAPLGNGDQGEPELLPLVLIHDSSGGTFNYFALGNLNRDVWAIHNPNYWEESPWVGGIDAMASHYIQLIEAAGISGPVVLGGKAFLLNRKHMKMAEWRLAYPISTSLQRMTSRLVLWWLCRNRYGSYSSGRHILSHDHRLAID